MKIFSNFDTKLKYRELAKWKKIYGEEAVLLLSKSKLFRWLRVDIPFFLYLLFALGLVIVLDKWLGKTAVIVGLVFLVIVFLILLKPLIKHTIDYHMDFIIFTPKQLLRYDQEWILRRDVTTINTHHIKTVTVKKKGLLYSMFNNGDLIFLSEGDVDHGEIMLTYIDNPNENRLKIADIMGRN